ncbi:hypothetical protein EV421DRAFT_1898595 [Armillaria borealis]|uniref:Uncharacterized protein n=1 Tax=Armillaria borealis TaxID=47425 RepID=A0AA39K1X5_9AGAR|nr:hypothetical protein EV421DRAFT_1898595 [Armillaria borealis]
MQPIPAGYPIAELSGPIIVACLLNWGLFGTLSMQLSFPSDRRLLKYLVYGIYTIEFVQTMIVAYDTFTVFGYGFGDIEVLTRMNHSWLTVPIMSAVAAGIGTGLLCIPNLHTIKVTNHPDIRHLCSLLCSISVAAQFIYLQISLTSSVAAVITGVYAFQAGNVIKLNNRKTSIALGIWCGASALCDILIAICMTCYASSFSILVAFIDADPIFVAYA